MCACTLRERMFIAGARVIDLQVDFDCTQARACMKISHSCCCPCSLVCLRCLSMNASGYLGRSNALLLLTLPEQKKRVSAEQLVLTCYRRHDRTDNESRDIFACFLCIRVCKCVHTLTVRFIDDESDNRQHDTQTSELRTARKHIHTVRASEWITITCARTPA